MNSPRIWLVIAVLLSPLGGQAAEREGKPDNVDSWLELQRSGQQASAQAQVQTPSERELSYQRWLESYKHAIPEWFDDSSGEQGGSSD
ncbi:DUF3613 domain-containing protein [Pseudomonas sp. LRF_L74]|uniref:DUF3613 domain-containing protein n=1 Tax=Pseudomonas sp. LRF_L74 TaxID=3369422 RepID=UPI003F5F6041